MLAPKLTNKCQMACAKGIRPSDLKKKTPVTYNAPPTANSSNPVTSFMSKTTIDGQTPTTK